ncbi:DUF6172 family protein [Curvibacter sp. HBC61]|uniref:DUF6172 family protein n=1 Tax=Curvibacter cyanobacteriorum TaxID=3026422 RepID=A0ABT5MUA9_9BURK|nr:DUF6172 family protein [Curvibacter sp. HBC61]MDD0837610.1 DUF6172 family protein [Curvibacter sp. HBC61]
MRKIFSFKAEGRHPDRVLDAVKHEIRKYLKRERRRVLPEGTDFWDFDCRFGLEKDSAEVVLLSTLIAQVDAAAKGGAEHAYVEILARAAQRPPRPPRVEGEGAEPRATDDDHPDEDALP